MDWVWWIGNCSIIILFVILVRFICDTVSRINRRSDGMKIGKKFANAATQTEAAEDVVMLRAKNVPKVTQRIKMPEPKIIPKVPDVNANFTNDTNETIDKPSVRNLRRIFEDGTESPAKALVRRNKLAADVRLRKPIFTDPVTISLVSKYMKPQTNTNSVVRRRRIPSNSDRVTSIDDILRQQRLSRSLSEYSVSEYVDEVENKSIESEFRKLTDPNRRSTPSFNGSFTEEFSDELWHLPGSRNSLIYRQSLTKCISTENIAHNGETLVTHYQSCFDLRRNPADLRPCLNRQESQSVSNLEEIYYDYSISKRFSQCSFPEI